MAIQLPRLDDLPDEWRQTQRLIRNQFRLSLRVPRRSSHTIGGPAKHKGTKCVECRRQLTLLWDIDLSDSLFSDIVRARFAPATRLPFYICWNCMAAAYRVVSDDKVVCFPALSELSSGESPFQETPNELPPRKIAFERVPSVIDGLLCLKFRLDDYDEESQRILRDFYRDRGKLIVTSDLAQSTLGGQSWRFQGLDNHRCRNPKCPVSKLEHYRDVFLPKDLGVLYVDADPVLAPHYFKLTYSVCCVCFTVIAGFQCT